MPSTFDGILLEKKMNWIKTSDKLPDDGQPVLCAIKGHNESLRIGALMRYCDVDGWSWHETSSSAWIGEPSEYEDMDDFNVTHWQRLPALPELADQAISTSYR